MKLAQFGLTKEGIVHKPFDHFFIQLLETLLDFGNVDILPPRFLPFSRRLFVCRRRISRPLQGLYDRHFDSFSAIIVLCTVYRWNVVSRVEIGYKCITKFDEFTVLVGLARPEIFTDAGSTFWTFVIR